MPQFFTPRPTHSCTCACTVTTACIATASWRFLRQSFKGRGNPSTFRKHVATDADAFEAVWATYVEDYAAGDTEEQ